MLSRPVPVYPAFLKYPVPLHQAKAVIFFVLVAGLGLCQLGYTRKKEVQQ